MYRKTVKSELKNKVNKQRLPELAAGIKKVAKFWPNYQSRTKKQPKCWLALTTAFIKAGTKTKSTNN
jgi:hypothetical protein